MRFVYFHLMPFDGLGDDFSSKNRSVWVDIDPQLQDVRRMHRLYNDYLDTLEYAALRGFDAIGVNEHHSNAYGLMSSPNMMGAALARRITDTNANILVMGDSVPLYNPPIRIAEELAMLDVLSGGRLITGFPVGSSQDTNFAYGLPPADVRERYVEGFDLILRAWTSNEVFTHNGRYSKLRYVNPWPKPLQHPHPPVWIPGSGSIETVDFAVERDLPYFILAQFGIAYAKSLIDRFWERVDAAGLDTRPDRAGITQLVMVADTDDEARRLYEPHLQYFFQKLTHIYPGFIEAPGYKSVDSLRAVLPPPGSKSVKRPDSFLAAREYGWDDMIERGIVIGGSPDTVRERLEAAARETNLANWVLMMHVGSMPRELALMNIDLFADKVMPSLRDTLSVHDHRWWPRPIEDFIATDVDPVARTEVRQ